VRSLRARVFLGSVLWTIGLLIAVMIILTALMLRDERLPGALHGVAHSQATVLSIVAAASMAAGLFQMRRGLSALDQLRARLVAVRDGSDPRVSGQHPSEVQPLVDDLNALLDHREKAVARAVARAGDLAHGLKTPLAVLAHEAERAAAAGHAEVATAIGQQVERMRRQIDYHLAQARAAASGVAAGARCLVAESAEPLSRTLLQLHAGHGVSIDLRIPADQSVRCQRQDLDEMLGNLLDNAFKYARSRIVLDSSRDGTSIVITIDDDGPGLAPSMRAAVLQRGVRADEAGPGSGLGLAIVADLAELYGGSVALDPAPAGGLRARLRLPAASP
jgi:signal transduction histidine kinase